MIRAIMTQTRSPLYTSTIRGALLCGCLMLSGCVYRIDIQQGNLDVSGNITIFGAHDGDTLCAKAEGAAGSMQVSCSTVEAAGTEASAFILEPEPFVVEGQVSPLAADRLRAKVSTSIPLARPPSVEIWQSEVEQNQVGRRGRQRFFTGTDQVNLEAFPRESGTEWFGDRAVVFDYQQAHGVA